MRRVSSQLITDTLTCCWCGMLRWCNRFLQWRCRGSKFRWAWRPCRQTRDNEGYVVRRSAYYLSVISNEMWLLTSGPMVIVPMIFAEFPSERTAGVFSRNITVTNKSNSLTFSVASSFQAQKKKRKSCILFTYRCVDDAGRIHNESGGKNGLWWTPEPACNASLSLRYVKQVSGEREDHRSEKYKSKNPHQRSPYVVKFEDRSHEETERQQRRARSKGWNLAQNIYKLKETDYATLDSPAEEWVLPGCVNKRAGGKRVCGGFQSQHAYGQKERPSLCRIGSRKSLTIRRRLWQPTARCYQHVLGNSPRVSAGASLLSFSLIMRHGVNILQRWGCDEKLWLELFRATVLCFLGGLLDAA